jgi:hypothetical protein
MIKSIRRRRDKDIGKFINIFLKGSFVREEQVYCGFRLIKTLSRSKFLMAKKFEKFR